MKYWIENGKLYIQIANAGGTLYLHSEEISGKIRKVDEYREFTGYVYETYWDTSRVIEL